MPTNDQSFEFSTYCNPPKLAEYLESLARNIREGNLQLSAAGKSIYLSFGPAMKVEFEAEVDGKKNRSSLQLEISWTQTEASGAEILIQSGAEARAASEAAEAEEEITAEEVA